MAGLAGGDPAGATRAWRRLLAAGPAPVRAGPGQRELTLLDRRDERAAIDGLLHAARDRPSATLVLRGEPGIGKTSLLDYAAGQPAAPGWCGCQRSIRR